MILKPISLTNCYDNNNDQSPNTKSHTLGGIINHKSNNSLSSCYHKKIISLIPLKSSQDLFINHSVVKIDENGLSENPNKNEILSGKVLFNISTNDNSKINNNYLKLDNKENSNDENIIYLSNKIVPKINKSASLFSIHYNKITNNYILTSFTDDIFFALEIWSNKNLYIEHSKRYYIQMSDIIISIKSNDNDKIITIKILNLKNEKNNNNDIKNKYIFEFNKVPITIGRNNCSINIEKNSISKVHLIINYDANTNQFFLRDNFSTNGSFVLLKNEKEITLSDKMFFFLQKEHFILKR